MSAGTEVRDLSVEATAAGADAVDEITDPADRRLALRAGGLLRTFNDANHLNAADVHVATRLGAIGGEADERVLLAVAVASRAVRRGSVCVDLREVAAAAEVGDLPWPEVGTWIDVVRASPLLEAGVIRWDHDLLYLDRYWRQERQVADDLHRRLALTAPAVDEALLDAGLARVFRAGYEEQRAAARAAAGQLTTVLTGGPGTGKTTAVAGLLAVLAEQAEAHGRRLRIALTAPTGKAASRLQEAVNEAAAGLPEADRNRIPTLTATTLHRLLGWRPDNSTRFRHHRGNRLPHDVIIADETSMVDLTMMARLLEAARDDTRLMLVGDPDQLASVDAGAVLADLVAGLGSGAVVQRLTTAHRFSAPVGALVDALRVEGSDGGGDEEVVLAALRVGDTDAGSGPAVEFIETDDPARALRPLLAAQATAIRAEAAAGDETTALAMIRSRRLLCAHRRGPFGVQTWNHLVERWLTEETGDPLFEPMYVGRPLLITANDYGLGLFNGDTGVVVRDDDGTRTAVVESTAGRLRLAPSRLADVDTMHAMTIHKSQGSEAAEITVLLPPADSPLLTRELLYTAITRARERVRVVGTEAAVRAAVRRPVQRASGLRMRLTPEC
ncbi:exodeoxyribonuclease V subunit alpha [Occultella aeris]|uniref:RecBCD enzyme subunit RecD n=1 Tax=Occultella aeris TaxID=2761496 RepID=A0A7M4DE64_9MICO|nr:exodeoxyribonuclease V subunit alpha [Occultella aeris]VZO35178.1 RecBCD enzyme subunit RecD [Occultella aeris]